VDASGDSVSSSVGLQRSGGRRKGDLMKYRVIQWGTGFVGKLALRATIEHPDLELVGLVVHGEDKVGRDAGKLIGQGPVGVTATNDVAAAAKIDADVVSYFANKPSMTWRECWQPARTWSRPRWSRWSTRSQLRRAWALRSSPLAARGARRASPPGSTPDSATT
jgi:hypothetical protein